MTKTIIDFEQILGLSDITSDEELDEIISALRENPNAIIELV